MENNNKDFLSVSNSILAGAVIIAVAIFLTSTGSGAGDQSAATAGTQVQGVEKNLTIRKDAPSEGNPDAKVVMVEFADFQCPFCKAFWSETYNKIKTNYINTGKVRFVYMHYPISGHVNAEKSAKAAECANRQGKFFPYHDILFSKSQTDGTGLDTQSLKAYAVTAGLDTAKFNSCLDSGDVGAVASADLNEGIQSGVTGTPTFFINGKKLVGALPYAEFESAIETALKDTK